MTLYAYLKPRNACADALKFCKGKTLEAAWNKCVEPEWLSWLISDRKVEKRKVMAAKAAIFDSERHLIDPAKYPAIDAALAYGAGKLTDAELEKARADYGDVKIPISRGSKWAKIIRQHITIEDLNLSL